MLSAPDLLPRGSHREPPSAKALLPYSVKLEFSLPPYGYMFAFFYLPSHVFGFTLLENDQRSFRPSGQVQLCPPNPGPESNALSPRAAVSSCCRRWVCRWYVFRGPEGGQPDRRTQRGLALEGCSASVFTLSLIQQNSLIGPRPPGHLVQAYRGSKKGVVHPLYRPEARKTVAKGGVFSKPLQYLKEKSSGADKQKDPLWELRCSFLDTKPETQWVTKLSRQRLWQTERRRADSFRTLQKFGVARNRPFFIDFS